MQNLDVRHIDVHLLELFAIAIRDPVEQEFLNFIERKLVVRRHGYQQGQLMFVNLANARYVLPDRHVSRFMAMMTT